MGFQGRGVVAEDIEGQTQAGFDGVFRLEESLALEVGQESPIPAPANARVDGQPVANLPGILGKRRRLPAVALQVVTVGVSQGHVAVIIVNVAVAVVIVRIPEPARVTRGRVVVAGEVFDPDLKIVRTADEVRGMMGHAGAGRVMGGIRLAPEVHVSRVHPGEIIVSFRDIPPLVRPLVIPAPVPSELDLGERVFGESVEETEGIRKPRAHIIIGGVGLAVDTHPPVEDLEIFVFRKGREPAVLVDLPGQLAESFGDLAGYSLRESLVFLVLLDEPARDIEPELVPDDPPAEAEVGIHVEDPVGRFKKGKLGVGGVKVCGVPAEWRIRELGQSFQGVPAALGDQVEDGAGEPAVFGVGARTRNLGLFYDVEIRVLPVRP